MAIGTLALALVTVALGVVAVWGNRTGRHALQVAQGELLASTLAILEAVPPESSAMDSRPLDRVDYSSLGSREEPRWVPRDGVDVQSEPGAVMLSVPVRNVGPGVALISRQRPQALSPPDMMWTFGECSRPMIPSGQNARLRFKLSGLREEAYAEVFYSDVSGQQPARLRLYVRGAPDSWTGEWEYTVCGTALYFDEDAVPFAISGDERVAEQQPLVVAQKRN